MEDITLVSYTGTGRITTAPGLGLQAVPFELHNPYGRYNIGPIHREEDYQIGLSESTTYIPCVVGYVILFMWGVWVLMEYLRLSTTSLFSCNS